MHGDVFRPPAHRMLLAACVGTGIQLTLLGLATILITISGTLFEVRWDVRGLGVPAACLRCTGCQGLGGSGGGLGV